MRGECLAPEGAELATDFCEALHDSFQFAHHLRVDILKISNVAPDSVTSSIVYEK